MGLTDAAIGGKYALGASSGSGGGLSFALSVLLASVIGSSWLGLAQPTIARTTARNMRHRRCELRLIDDPLFIVDIPEGFLTELIHVAVRMYNRHYR